jgi:predicted nucleic acid-binding protein
MIVDASVALMWLVREQHSRKALSLLSRDDLTAPDLIDIELGQGLTRLFRQRRFPRAEAERLWLEAPNLPVRRRASAEVANEAFDLSLRLRATFNDCLYLALALVENRPLVTADERFVRSVQTDRTLQSFIVSLVDL